MTFLQVEVKETEFTGSADALVVNTTGSKIRTFLYELAEGTSNYRSLHSLTEQVEHQYHGRFIVELIQNAHDALFPPNDESGFPSRIEVALKNEGEFGTLYVANDGRSFSASNFNSLSQLGQSDKNPQESIGNKGIGFRSVLEVTESPEIYSRSDPNSSHFDGFCFAFSPDLVRRLTTPILALLEGDDRAEFPFSDAPLVDWDERLLAKFRTSVINIAKKEGMLPEVWLTRELAYLSPYLLPFPTNKGVKSSFVKEFERRGFSTVIRFPIKNSTTLALVREKINAVDNTALLFLEKSKSLVLDSGHQRRELSRNQKARQNSIRNGREVSISEVCNGHVRRYWVWTHDITLTDAPEKVRMAVQQLPGKWPKLQEVAVSIGVRLGEKPELGTLSIFLPTFLESGCAAHINAPFFSDMSRTHIDFGSVDDLGSSIGAIYNQFLLSQAAQLATSITRDELAGHGIDEARAVLDLLAPWGSDQAANVRWQQLTARAASESDANITTTPWFLSNRGWGTLGNTLLLPEMANPRILTPQTLREHAAFFTYIEGLDFRRELIRSLALAHGINPIPARNELASTVESIAMYLNKDSGANWNGFWLEVDELFGGDCSALAGKQVLLGNDGQLHAGGGDDCTIFFIPRQGASDDEDIENEGDVKEIPSTLRPFVAFLSEHIQAYEENNGRLQQTRVRKLLLDSKLVSRFRREDILTDILVPRTPPLPVSLYSRDAALCRDILLWALRLMAPVVERGKGEKTLRLLKNLPAPCIGGWYPLGESSFGAGWPGTQGDVTQDYLTRLNTPEAREAHHRLLVPPGDVQWGGNGAVHINLHRLVGVFDGLRLISIDPKSWGSSFQANRSNFLLPQTPPPTLTKEDWNEYRSYVGNVARPSYNDGHYEIQQLFTIPGIDKYPELDDEARLALMKVVLGSAGQWEECWHTLQINRVVGNWNSLLLQSPLAQILSRVSWLGLPDGDSIEWCRPADRWHVPALELARGRKWQFAHLKPLPGELADRLDMDSRLAAVMRRLGTPRFDPEEKSSSTELLDALAKAVVQDKVPHWDIFLGQVRSAWRGFEPERNSAFPEKILVQRGASRLTAESPDEENQVYLPDSAKSFMVALKHFALPVIAIETEDAKRLAERFTAAYPGGVLRASDLRPVPLVNGDPWNEVPQDRLRDDGALEWIIPVLLTIAAFHGPQSQGTATKAFKKQIETFRSARLCVVGIIETNLFRDEIPVAPPLAVPALWLNASHTLLLSNEWKSDLPSLSEALSNILDREDLEVPIKLMLSITGSQPENKDITRALEQLKLSNEHYRDVREHWRGDVSQIIELCIPLLTILIPEANIGELVELDSDDAVTEFLNRFNNGLFNGDRVVKMARESADMFDFGTKAFLHFGDSVQLSKWNAALSLRDHQLLVNRDAKATFDANLQASAHVMRSLLAAISARNAELGTFNVLWEQFDALACPDDFENQYWDVSFNTALAATIPLLMKWHATSKEIAAVRAAVSTEELIALLAASGIDVKFDPIHVARDNRERLRNSLIRLQQIGLAWALENSYQNPSDWESRVEDYLNHLSLDIEASAFTFVWSEQDIWTFLQKLPIDESSAAFWAYVAAASSLDDLVVQIGLTNDALSTANKTLDSLREDARRRNKIIEICGKEFDGSDDNLSGLWNHICSGLPVSSLSDLDSVDLNNQSDLEILVKRSKQNRINKEHSSKMKQKYLSKSMENLIGLSGEIHAFRMLQNTYGASKVSASSWVSGNSSIVFPDNKTDDGRGCDFVVSLHDRTYFIEVKSSEGENNSFTMGSSEIRLAMELAKKPSRRRREIFLVLRVSNTLTTMPSFQLLPNPYDQKYQSLFVIEEADARVSYQSKKCES